MVKLKDNLQERGLIDRWGFVGFAVVGAILIWFFKQETSIPTEALALGATALMGAYAWIVSARGTGKLRSDQAGDNCYYLGLIYTLISLSHAIFTFDPANTATTIVQGFGIALLTTIFGLVLRVFFNQSRVDLQEIEDTARLELAEAAGKLKTQLSQVANRFSDFAFGIQQSLEELQGSARGSIQGAAEECTVAIRELAKTTGEDLRVQSGSLSQCVGDLTKATTKTVAALDKHANSLERLTAQQLEATESLRIIESAVNSAAQGSEEIRQQLSSAAASQSQISSASAEFSTSVSRLQSAVSESIQTLGSLQTNFEARLSELEKAPQGMMDGALKAIAGAAERLQGAIDSLAAGHENAGRSIESLSSSVVQALKAHNAEMETELSRSRNNAAKFQDALVDAANTLSDQIERRTAP